MRGIHVITISKSSNVSIENERLIPFCHCLRQSASSIKEKRCIQTFEHYIILQVHSECLGHVCRCFPRHLHSQVGLYINNRFSHNYFMTFLYSLAAFMITREEFYDLSGVEDARVNFKVLQSDCCLLSEYAFSLCSLRIL